MLKTGHPYILRSSAKGCPIPPAAPAESVRSSVQLSQRSTRIANICEYFETNQKETSRKLLVFGKPSSLRHVVPNNATRNFREDEAEVFACITISSFICQQMNHTLK
eukprot:1181105-Prorocentrum_minimum.AAC.4